MTLAGTIRRLRPKTVILPTLNSRHPDAHYAAELGWEACVLSGIPAMDAYSEPHYAERVLFCADENSQFVVDVTVHIEAMEKSLACYQTRFRDLKSEISRRKVTLQYLGSRVGTTLAEGFSSKDLFSIKDVVRMDLKTSW